jgi:hypothetical protein
MGPWQSIESLMILELSDIPQSHIPFDVRYSMASIDYSSNRARLVQSAGHVALARVRASLCECSTPSRTFRRDSWIDWVVDQPESG